MSEKKLKVGHIVLIKEKFMLLNKHVQTFKQTGKILISYKFKHSDDGFKYFIGYLHDDDVIRPLCIVLPEVSGCIKYFDNGGKNVI